MVEIIVQAQNPRLNYAIKVLFEIIYKIPYQINSSPSKPSDLGICTIFYQFSPKDNAIFIPQNHNLEKNDFRGEISEKINVLQKNIQNNSLIYSEKKFPFDIFAYIYYKVSQINSYQQRDFDVHERYLQQPPDWDDISQPWIHIWAQLLANFFPASIQNEIMRKQIFEFTLTWDIDNPWKYLHRGWGMAIGGLVKSVLKGDIKAVTSRIQAYFSHNDPYHTFDAILQLCPPANTIFFYLIDRNSPYDTRYTWKHPVFRTLIQKITSAGYKAGIHPSYTSFLDAHRILKETQALSTITQTQTIHSRQHFLKYRLPDTFRHLMKAGITHDYTLCPIAKVGFPCGMAVPFPWFDDELTMETTLMLHPTMVMDRSLQKYMQLSPQAASDKTIEIIRATQAVGGNFTILFHNEALSEVDEWKGWSAFVKNIISELHANKAGEDKNAR